MKLAARYPSLPRALGSSTSIQSRFDPSPATVKFFDAGPRTSWKAPAVKKSVIFGPRISAHTIPSRPRGIDGPHVRHAATRTRLPVDSRNRNDWNGVGALGLCEHPDTATAAVSWRRRRGSRDLPRFKPDIQVGMGHGRRGPTSSSSKCPSK